MRTVAERAFQKEGKRGQRRDIYKKGGWGRSKSDHNPDLRNVVIMRDIGALRKVLSWVLIKETPAILASAETILTRMLGWFTLRTENAHPLFRVVERRARLASG